MLNHVPEKKIFWESLITFFYLKKTATESYRLLGEAYDKHAPIQKTCKR